MPKNPKERPNVIQVRMNHVTRDVVYPFPTNADGRHTVEHVVLTLHFLSVEGFELKRALSTAQTDNAPRVTKIELVRDLFTEGAVTAAEIQALRLAEKASVAKNPKPTSAEGAGEKKAPKVSRYTCSSKLQ